MSLTAQLGRWAILLPWLAPLALFAWFKANPEHDVAVNSPIDHFYVVVAVTLLAIGLAGGVLRAALKLRHTPTFFLGLAFLSVAGIFLVHGISTPGVFRGPNAIVVITAWLSLIFGGVFLALSIYAENAPWVPWVSRAMPALFKIAVVVLVAFGVLAIAMTPPVKATIDQGAGVTEVGDHYHGAALPPIVEPGYDDDSYGPGAGNAPSVNAPKGIVPIDALTAEALIFGLLCYGAAAIGYWRRYLQTELLLVGALAVSSVLLFDAVVSMFLGDPWHLSWWLYHALMLAGFGVGAGAVLWESHRGRTLHRVIEGMYVLRNEVELELQYTDAIAAMAAATEAKDPVTQGHTLRVAHLATRIGREMRLNPSRVRVLARASLLHDIGKLRIPDAILKKPGALTDEEFEIMKQHPLLGHDILRGIGELDEEISILIAHHERIDGKGYPYGRSGDGIPLEARILSVADFFDALTSDRPYRRALEHNVALELTYRSVGKHLDAECFDALCCVVDVGASDPLANHGLHEAELQSLLAGIKLPELAAKSHY